MTRKQRRILQIEHALRQPITAVVAEPLARERWWLLRGATVRQAKERTKAGLLPDYFERKAAQS